MSKFDDEFLADLKDLTTMQLRKKYKGEANSHRNMLMRGKNQGKKIAPELQDFRSFLEEVGPKPSKSATLDRINNNDREYSSKKVRWADKRTQNSNKGDSLLFYCSTTNQTYTTAQLAGLQKMSKETIRKRRERGWTDDEIIKGVRKDKVEVQAFSGPTNPRLIGLVDSRISHADVPEEMRPKIMYDKISGDCWHIGKNGYIPFFQRLSRWQDNEDRAIYARKVSGNECVIAIFPDFVEIFADLPGFHPNDKDGCDKTFWEWWVDFRQHVIREKMEPYQLAYVIEVEEKFEPKPDANDLRDGNATKITEEHQSNQSNCTRSFI